MAIREVEEITTRLLEPIIDANHFELVDVEYIKEGSTWYLRVYIDKEGGITIDDCELVSRALEVELDEKDPVPNPYILEVSSPGLDRPLKKDKDYEKSIGQLVEIKLYKAIDKQKEFIGILKAFTSEAVTIELENEEEIEFLRSDIALIRLAIVF